MFQGEGDTTIVSGDLDEPVFRLLDSKSVTVRKISIDHAPLGYTQGTITGVDIPTMTCEVAIDPGYPAPNDPTFKGAQVHRFVFPEKNYYQLDRYWPNPIEMTEIGERTWRWKLTGSPTIENGPNNRFFIYSENRSRAFILSGLRDTTLEDINYWGGGANAGFYANGLEGTTTFRRFVIGVPLASGRLYSCTDGIDRLINVATVGQETIIRDSTFQVFHAKCLNLKAADYMIERCTFSNSFQPVISAAPEWYFEEGSSIRNFTVRGCTFTDNNHPNIVVAPHRFRASAPLRVSSGRTGPLARRLPSPAPPMS